MWQKIKVKFMTMQKMYSPEKKVMLLLRVCKLIYTVMESNSGEAPTPCTPRPAPGPARPGVLIPGPSSFRLSSSPRGSQTCTCSSSVWQISHTQ